MEYVDGVNLRQAMRASRFEPRQALHIVPKICEALQYAHDEGVLHRDIKPENILLDTRGRVKLVDFGIAKLTAESDAFLPGKQVADDSLTQAGAALGTPSYMAPEQREQPSRVDHRADIYSLGVVFYELLTGELPAGAFAPPSAKSTADPRVDAIVQQALEKERERRQHSAAEFRTQVEQINAPIPHGLRKKIHPRWRKAGIAGAVTLAILGILRAFFVQPFRVPTDATAPEVPRGSHVLVWKPAQSFAAGDLIAYDRGDSSSLGRVVRSEGENVIVNRNNSPELAVPRSAIIGRVISVYWRGDSDRKEQSAIPSAAPPQGSPGASLAFGSVIERVLPFGAPCEEHYLQFRSGAVVDVGHGPGTTAEQDKDDWKRANDAGGVDVSALGGEERMQFVSEGCVFTKDHSPDWEKQTAEDAVKQLQRATWITGVIEPKKSELPVTYLFKTSRGEHGIMQLLDIVADPRGYHGQGHNGYGVKLRYKMVQPAPAH